jgi:hypothetical protein
MHKSCASLLSFLMMAVLMAPPSIALAVQVRENFTPYATAEQALAEFRSGARNPAEHLREHRDDKKACVDAFALLKTDRVTVDRLVDGATDEFPGFPEVLAASKFANEKPVRYLSQNRSRFVIDVDFHASDAAANIGEVRCWTYLGTRIQLVERGGASASSWVLRKEQLNQMRDNLAYPHWELTDGLYDFESFLSVVTDADRTYRKTYPKIWKNWLRETVQILRRYPGQPASDVDQTTVIEQRKVVTVWAGKLDALRQQLP